MIVPKENISNQKILTIYFDSKVKNDIRDLSDYVTKIDNFLEADKARLLDQRERDKEEGEDSSDSHNMMHSLLYRLGYERHLDIFTRSAVATIYTFLEFMLNDICEKVEMITSTNIKLIDFKGNGIVRSKEYLEKVHSIDFSAIKTEWDFLLNFNSVRNSLSHAAGSLEATKSSNKLANIIGSTNGLELVRGKELKVTPEYLNFCLEVIETFILSLTKQVCHEEAA